MSDLRLAWLSGFWDGEGSVGLVKSKNTKILRAQLSHTERETVVEILTILSENNVNGRGYTYQERDPTKHRDAHYVRVNGMANVLRLARLLIPYAITKKRHWQIAIDFASSRIALAGGLDAKGHLFRGGIGSARGYSNGELALAHELSCLNKRGPIDRISRKENGLGRILA